jgi:hypothetical protein
MDHLDAEPAGEVLGPAFLFTHEEFTSEEVHISA